VYVHVCVCRCDPQMGAQILLPDDSVCTQTRIDILALFHAHTHSWRPQRPLYFHVCGCVLWVWVWVHDLKIPVGVGGLVVNRGVGVDGWVMGYVCACVCVYVCFWYVCAWLCASEYIHACVCGPVHVYAFVGVYMCARACMYL